MAVSEANDQGRLITFYSYKGGTGRTMALANIACLLARSHQSPKSRTASRPILAIDWDLEAPGLFRYLAPLLDPQAREGRCAGLIELFENLSSSVEDYKHEDSPEAIADELVEHLDLTDYVIPTNEPGLSFMPAGRLDANYPARITSFDWERLMSQVPTLMTAFARRLASEFSYVLIDSRTGLNDTSGICTALLPDMLVTVFTPNLQSLLGLSSVIEDVVTFRRESPDTRRLTVLPLASRVETARPSLLEYWRIGNAAGFRGYQREFESVLGKLYNLDQCDLSRYFDEVQVQHVPDYAYGEEIAAISEAATDNRLSLKRSYEDFTTWLVADTPPWIHPSIVSAAAEIYELCERASRALDDGKLDSARRVLYLALDQPEAAKVSGGAELAAVLSRLARAQADADRLADAEQAMADAADVAELALGTDDPMAAVYLERQAELLARLKRPADARRLLSKVVARRREIFGANHIAVAEAYEKLGAVLGELDDITGSTDSLTKGLEIRRALFGTDQPFRAGSVNGLAKAYGQIAAAQRQHGNPAAAEEWYQLCVAIYEKEGDTAGLADSYLQLSDLARDRGDYDANGRWNQLRLSIVRKLNPTPATQAVLRIAITRAPASGDSPAQRQVELSWHDGSTRWVAASTFGYQMSEVDAEKIRWYLEDYPEYPADSDAGRVDEAESALAKAGTDLFREVFARSDAAQIWERARDRLGEVRVEVAADPGEDAGLAWELLLDPDRDTAVAIQAKAFVRARISAAASATLPQAAGETLRVLLVIPRPGNHHGAPFRSAGRCLVRAAADQETGLDLHVLRPATFDGLSQALQAAYDAGRPFHVVHFDGHGAFVDLTDRQGSAAASSDGGASRAAARRGAAVTGKIRDGQRGYLVFEDPDSVAGQRLVDGPSLGRLLADTGAPVLALSACEAASAETFPDPLEAEPPTETAGSSPVDAADRGSVYTDMAGDASARAYESLAAEVAHAGVPGVVTMRYNLYVVTAAQFMADLYAQLLAGQPLGQAATAARRTLATNTVRQVGLGAVTLQDWVVPVVYEAAPLALLRPGGRAAPLIRITAEAPADQEPVGPRLSEVGFFGRDETLLALDRAFDAHRLVLLHSFAGSGKSATAAEFARWYQATGGLGLADRPEWPGAVLWSSFEHHLTADRVIGIAGDFFASLLEANGVAWAAISDPGSRRDIVLQLLAQVPALWVWDNVEPVAGFPTGTPSEWSAAEQAELADLLRDLAQRTKCKVLLTSRRDERSWLGELPARVALPPMPMRESLQLAAALAARHSHEIADLDWRPLLRYAAGNPLTITVLVSQALRENLSTDQAMADFLARLRGDEAHLDTGEDLALGRTRPQVASLSYALVQGFTDGERAQIAVLHLFRNAVNLESLPLMGNPEVAGEDAVPELAGLDSDTGAALLDRVADIGMLTRLGGAYYAIQPALSWHFTALFTPTYGQPGEPAAEHANRAFAKVIAGWGAYLREQFDRGRREALDALRVEEGNLRQALDCARAASLWPAAAACLQGLSTLYSQTGRNGEWARLVAEITPDFTDPVTGGPLPGRDEQWRILTGDRVQLARQARDWMTAIALQNATIVWNRERAADALTVPPASLTKPQRGSIRDLAGSLFELGNILREQDDPACLAAFQEALDLIQRIGDPDAEAVITNTLGGVYLAVPALRDLDQAEKCFRSGLATQADEHRLARALSGLGAVALERFRDARAAGEDESVLLGHLNAAVRSYQQALDVTDPYDHVARGINEQQLGGLYRQAGDIRQALRHYEQAISHNEAIGDSYGAGQTRYNIAALLAADGRAGEALQYARAALGNFQQAGPQAAADVDKTRQLLTSLEKGT